MIPFISEDRIRTILTEKKAFKLALETFFLISQKKTIMPSKLYLNLPKAPGSSTNDFRAMPAFIQTKNKGICGVKWVSVFPDNHRIGKPTVYGTIIMNSASTGSPLAVLEANHITAVRTGAAAACATHFLANPAPQKLAIIGAGLQARYQLRALADLYKFKEIGIWGFARAESKIFCDHFKRLFRGLRAYESIRDCVRDADIIVTCTPSRKPLLNRKWVKKGAHINAIGADAKGKEELDPTLLLSSKVIVDDWEQASHSGEVNVPVSRSLFTKRNLYAELSDIVSKKKRGRTSLDEVTIFDSTGLAVLDIYFAGYVYDRLQK